MVYLIKSLILISISSFVNTNEEISRTFTSNVTRFHRVGRENYGPYSPPKVYGAIGEYKDDIKVDLNPSPFNGKPVPANDFSSSDKYKGDNKYDDYSIPSYSPFANNYKGYPLYSNGFLSPNTDPMLQMLMNIKSTGAFAKPEEAGLLSKFGVDPKIATTAIIPLSIVAAAVVPVLMNLIMGGASSPTISTTANKKEARSDIVSLNFENFMENMFSLARNMDNEECILKTICKVACGQSAIPVSDHVKEAASKISKMVQDDLLNKLQIKNLIDGVRQGNCSNVCTSSG
ncbi:uncharacterized protein TNIN_12931 [Trichonephila inaurata madagascariensis]|uniref:Uncharacterized protein n=1 Tax=Trichonephila inaurata madagascariensis TaxID=2747483 RepID=A0A8X6YHI8_9ARAC|nr:uncharacterized protein TNIN_12931 [Trichonephila inaurata madagascariensis]